MEISDLVGKTPIRIEQGDDKIQMEFEDGTATWFHRQDCCESVWVEDVSGDWDVLVGSPLTIADEASSDGEGGESFTWTFYRFATVKGYVGVRWIGESSGYYSEYVYFLWEPKKEAAH